MPILKRLRKLFFPPKAVHMGIDLAADRFTVIVYFDDNTSTSYTTSEPHTVAIAHRALVHRE